ncbi:hypothetical protein SEA_LILMARTIN_239 [Streptomyces phage LilMartin]|nr:hypothetical protein SEA_LILMARTIN_239 [Streptomyces phage LilMartin]QNO12626.1 hypothetical protein SEA_MULCHMANSION_243 [Streptomyces phage MulchMansion]UVK61294.1 hypothetical protein SEA_ANGELA_243 [Streptomyces phage Angela]
MQNTDGYTICPSVEVQAISHGEKFINFKTGIGDFGLLRSRFAKAIFTGDVVTLYINGLNEVVGMETLRGLAYYIEPDDYENYIQELIRKG